MSDNKKLIAEARKVAGKGVSTDDGFTYLVPAADLAEYWRVINGLISTLEQEDQGLDEVRAEAERRYPTNHTVDDPFGATGEAQSDPYGYEDYARTAFIAGAKWQAVHMVEKGEQA